jgi:RHS repeat-associated protein
MTADSTGPPGPDWEPIPVDGDAVSSPAGNDGPATPELSLPAISTPTGGGAIRGIGEKVSVNPVTGTGAVSVPLPVSPARAGSEPLLALQYDSGAGNGPFGMGWSLSVPAITRKTTLGLPRYDDEAESDVFLLSDVEDLVPELGADGLRCRDMITAPGFTIHRYRPRIEGSFARIERWVQNATGKTHWRSISASNVTTVYGHTAESQIADPDEPLRIFSWLICERYDDRGNATLYSYAAENEAAIDTSLASEHGRDRRANRYLKRIRYGNRVSRLLDADLTRAEWLFELVFDYGEGHYEELAPGPALPPGAQHQIVRATAGPELPWDAPDRRWRARPDPFSSHRSGFEVRTYRRCERVLMFHRIPELGGQPYLVRATTLRYADFDYARPFTVDAELTHQGSTRAGSFIQSITESGFVRDEGGPPGDPALACYIMRSLPPLKFEYSRLRVDDQVRELDPASEENLPTGLDDALYQWVDLDGEGISGLVSQRDGGWYYKANLGDGRFGPLELLRSTPSTATTGAAQRLLDLTGDGRLALADLAGTATGYYRRAETTGWAPYRPFESIPRIAWEDPNLRLVDLTGDGLADVLITEEDAFTWYESEGDRGFRGVHRVFQPLDEDCGPRLIFADGTESIYLADMCGDGLTDLVRIRNGEVCYWSSLGYGRFTAKVTMDASPWFDELGQFDQQRVLLADLDGSGTTDLVYLADDGPRLYFNQAGNRWTAARPLTRFPALDSVANVRAVDLLGHGTACLVWSSPLPGESARQLRYVDLAHSRKPHLMVKVTNNLGTETTVQYASSTKFYLADRAEGRPWVSRLPFPVQVIERFETSDHINRNRFVTLAKYHDGYFDGVEREFRGFGMVEHLDTEHLEVLGDGDGDPDAEPTNVTAASNLPPTLTRTWFHTGIDLRRHRISTHVAEQYYGAPCPDSPDYQARLARFIERELLPDSGLAGDLTVEEEREARRALKGAMLRQEVYGLDGSPASAHPYTVTEQSYTVRCDQRRIGTRHAVFYTHPREALSSQYERDPGNPRISHALTLEVDAVGNVRKEASVGYGRGAHQAARPPDDHGAQAATLIKYIERDVTNGVDTRDDHRTAVPCSTRTYELTGYVATGPRGRFLIGDFAAEPSAGPGQISPPVDHEVGLVDASRGPRRCLLTHVRTLFRADDLTGLLPLGVLMSHAFPGQTYRLTLTDELVRDVFQRHRPGLPAEPFLRDPCAVLGGRGPDGGGYVAGRRLTEEGLFPAGEPEGRWWAPSIRLFYSPDPDDTAAAELRRARRHFFQPRRSKDPFGAVATVRFDAHDLIAVDTRDAVGNRVTVGERLPDGEIDPAVPGIDYRVLKPIRVTDPNRNRTAVAFDALGLIAGVAVMGKPPPAPAQGDSLAGFVADLTEAEIIDHMRSPLADPAAVLAQATQRFIYDVGAFARTHAQLEPDPAASYALVRETHSAGVTDQATRFQHRFSYADGFGRVIQAKAQAAPGPVPGAAEGFARHRWVGSGWTVWDNKGNAVRRYEPFFTASHHFEFAKRAGVSAIRFYDPLSRLVATLYPNHTYSKVVFDPWRRCTFNADDTVAPRGVQTGDPRTDPDVRGYMAGFFATLADAPAWQTWYAQRRAGALGPEAAIAAEQAAVHADTPATMLLDTLGRPVLMIEENRFLRGGTAVEERHVTRAEFDILGRQLAVSDGIVAGDPRGRVIACYTYDLLGHRIRVAGIDSGERWALYDAAGRSIRAWDSLGRAFRADYDPLRRPLRSYVAGLRADDPRREILTERNIFGEQHPHAERDNLRASLYAALDQAGLVVNECRDFKGNVLRSARRLAEEYDRALDWTDVDLALPACADATFDAAALEAALTRRLEADSFAGSTTYDALNRPVTLTMPHTAAMAPSTIRPRYDEANQIAGLGANLHAETRGGSLVWTPFVTRLWYNARGQREEIRFGNGARTSYRYDPLTFDLIHLVTRRSSGSAGSGPRAGWPGSHLQNLHYTYDPTGHISHIRDDAQQALFFRNKRVDPGSSYVYDALYRLIEASGREHLGQAGYGPAPWSYNDAGRVGLPWSANDGAAMARYTERYRYDFAGNLTQLHHRSAEGGQASWTRFLEYDDPSRLDPHDTGNRLSRSRLAAPVAATERYAYDAHGNTIRMPHLDRGVDGPNLAWDYRNRLATVRLGSGGTAHYSYDAAGTRVRKVWRKSESLVEERIYIGGTEIFRRRRADQFLERETLHILVGQARVALVESRLRDTARADRAPAELQRYQLTNQLGSSTVELDARGRIISYEEYSPFGSTAYQAIKLATETPKRYRFSGKERDEETGLNYHGARYYAPWLGRWTSCDPDGLRHDRDAYVYCRDDPVNNVDLTGRWDVSLKQVAIGAVGAALIIGVAVLTAGVATPALAAGLAYAGVGAETISTLGMAATATGAVLGIAGTADTFSQVTTGHDLNGNAVSDDQRSRQLGALPIVFAASLFGLAKFGGSGGAGGAVENGGLNSGMLNPATANVPPLSPGAVAIGVPSVPLTDSVPALTTGAGIFATPQLMSMTGTSGGGSGSGGGGGAGSGEASPSEPSPGDDLEEGGVCEEQGDDEDPRSVGTYRSQGGHHVHQSASYSSGGPSATGNPNHSDAITVALEGHPADPGSEHGRATITQRLMNQGAGGNFTGQEQVGEVTIEASGNGELRPTPNQTFEDVKAYYSMTAADAPGFQTPDDVYGLVCTSADQLPAAPVRVPSR